MIHFLGGAFAGAAPQLLYNSFVELLADEGYTVISTPYKVTFQHDVCARQVCSGAGCLLGPDGCVLPVALCWWGCMAAGGRGVHGMHVSMHSWHAAMAYVCSWLGACEGVGPAMMQLCSASFHPLILVVHTHSHPNGASSMQDPSLSTLPNPVCAAVSLLNPDS